MQFALQFEIDRHEEDLETFKEIKDRRIGLLNVVRGSEQMNEADDLRFNAQE